MTPVLCRREVLNGDEGGTGHGRLGLVGRSESTSLMGGAVAYSSYRSQSLEVVRLLRQSAGAGMREMHSGRLRSRACPLF